MSISWDTACVYIIATVKDGALTGPVKIGLAADPNKRLRALQTGSPYVLQIATAFPIGVRDLASMIERSFHDNTKDLALAGEWYDMTPLEATTRLCQAVREHLEDLANRLGGDLERALADAKVLWHEEYIAHHTSLAALSSAEPVGHG